MSEKRILDVTEDVKWVGVLDPDLETFDVVMTTKYGTTYNSYFIDADKKALVETAKEGFKEGYIEKIEELTDLEDLEYIILNHTEPDHSSSLKSLLEKAPNAKVVGSRSAINFMKNMMDVEFESLIVKGGDTLDLGNKTLRFIDAPFLHWPDSIYTYLEEDKVLFTCDSFGCHFCDERMYDDLVDKDDFLDAFDYYFHVILKPFSKHMLTAIDRIEDLEIEAIAPGHGPILRTYWKESIERSKKLAEETEAKRENLKVYVPYVSAYGYTGVLAEKIAEGIKSVDENIEVEVEDIEHAELGDLEAKVYTSDAFLIGSPTINQNTLLPIYQLLAIMHPIRSRGKLAGAFGSFGWSGEAVKIIQDNLKNLKLKLYDDKGLKVTFRPNEEDMEKAVEYGKGFAEKLLKMQK